MKKFHYIKMFVLAIFILGCTSTISKDMQLSNQALEYISKHNYIEAENYLNQVLANNPNNSYALLNLGVVYQNTSRTPEAKAMYEKVIKLNPKDVVGQSNIEGERGKTLTDLAKDKLNKLILAGEADRFIAYKDGTVLDTKTSLMWAAKDNGSGINWPKAKSYCENYRGGGYKDWRVPTQDELAGLYDASKSRPGACNPGFDIHVATELIDITCFAHWAYETRIVAAPFDFGSGLRYWDPQTYADGLYRALPVRFAE